MVEEHSYRESWDKAIISLTYQKIIVIMFADVIDSRDTPMFHIYLQVKWKLLSTHDLYKSGAWI